MWVEEEQILFFDKYITDRKDFVLIITIDGQDVGFFDEKKEKDFYEIVNICIEKSWQNKGIGSQILKQKVKENSDKTIKIQCFISNPVLNLYKKLGFREMERNRTHIKLEKSKTKD
ncbi:MAG: GNAT family N-acetyltransferase [Clostridia bacterium]|nr:GNAT family N-acetyltransferase [Clostridia bacterium]